MSDSARLGASMMPGSVRQSYAQTLPINSTLQSLAFIGILVLATWNLEYYPRAWWDEGLNLVGAKTLAQTGLYGTQSSDGVKLFDSMLTTGPTVIGPVALTFRLFGVGLFQARLVMVVYIVLAALGLYWLGSQLYGRNVAVAALFVFASLNDAGPFDHGRPAIGEMPALAYLFWGAGFLLWARRSGRRSIYLAGALLVGLAILTKAQFLPIVPIFAALWLLSRARSSGLELVRLTGVVTVMLTPLALWHLYQLSVLGLPEFQRHMSTMGAAGSIALGSSPRRAYLALEMLREIGFIPQGLCAIAYSWISAFQSPRRNVERELLLAFATLWLLFFVAGTVGWIRYAVVPVVCSSLFAAKLLFDLGSRVLAECGLSPLVILRSTFRDPFPALLLIGLSLPVALGTIGGFDRVARNADATPQKFAALIEKGLEPESLVESYEWEIIFLTDRRYHHPPVELMADANRVSQGRQPPESMGWYRIPPGADYLVDGHMSKLFNVYDAELQKGEFQRIASSGEYDLYKRVSTMQNSAPDVARPIESPG